MRLPVIASGFIALLFSHLGLSNDVIKPFRCAEHFSEVAGSFEVSLYRYPGGDISVREWLSGLKPSQVKQFVPRNYHTELNEEVITNPGVKKLLSKFVHRINLEKGALFALSDSLAQLHQEIEELAHELNDRPVLVKQAYQDFVSGKFRAPSTQISEEEKNLHDNILQLYEESSNRKVHLNQHHLSEHEQKLLTVDLRLINQALQKGSTLNKAIEYQASLYLERAKNIRKKRQEVLEAFAQVAQNHFATEELMMTYFGADLPQFQKHLSEHLKGVNEFEARAKDVNSKLDLSYQSKKTDQDYHFIHAWLKSHIESLDRPDYMSKLISEQPERFFSGKNKIPKIISGREDKHWKFNEKGISSVNEFLLKVLNSEQVFY